MQTGTSDPNQNEDEKDSFIASFPRFWKLKPRLVFGFEGSVVVAVFLSTSSNRIDP
jgi:hypothetical protein